MDSVLVNFQSGIDALTEKERIAYKNDLDDVPGIFAKMEPVDGAIEAYEHAIVFARPFRVRGVAIETQAVAFFTTESVEQFVSVFVSIRCYRVGHFSVQLFFFLFCSFFSKQVLCVCVYVIRDGKTGNLKLFFSSFFLLLFFFFGVCFF